MPNSGETIAVMKTNMGDIYIRLFKKDAPDAVENFTVHAESGYYDGLIFHRVINDFMIQSGDPTGTGRGGESVWGTPFPDYFTGNLYHYRGALSMANSGYNTNGSQFFIVQAGPLKTNEKATAWLENEEYDAEAASRYLEIGGTPWLDNGHTMPTSGNDGHMVFGQVFKGMDVVDAIAAVPLDMAAERPVVDVIITTIEITKYK
ncbi:MAG: peptidylprolyl isomerase [Clostridia bacterium]